VESKDMTAFINHNNKIIFVHTPKTGGTSITDCMVGLEKSQQAAQIFGIDTPNVEYVEGGHATTTELRNKYPCYDSYFSFAVMREPFSWLSSLFRYRYHRDILSDAVPTPYCNFELFIDEFYNIGEKLQSYWFTVKGKIDVKKVIEFEKLDTEINKYFNIKRPLKRINVGENKDIQPYLSKEIIEKARKLLEKDLRLYETIFKKRQ
jgi:hypothetical protein